MADENLPTITESQWNSQFNDTDIPVVTESQWNTKFAQPEADLFSWDTIKNAGQSLAKGATDTAGFLADYNPFTPDSANRLSYALGDIGRLVTGSETEMTPDRLISELTRPSKQFNTAREDYIGNATPRNTLERYADKALEFLPSAMSANLLALTSAATSGLGAELAKDAGAPEWLGALAGGLSPTLAGALTRPLTGSGQRVLAGADLLSNAGGQGRQNLLEALAGKIDNEFGPTTYAELANSPSAAAFQTAVRKIPGEGANTIEQALVGTADNPGRALLREQALKDLAPDAMQGISPVTRGDAIQPIVNKIVKDAWEDAKDNYISPMEPTAIPILDAQTSAIGTQRDLFGNSKLSMDASTRKIFQGLTEGGPVKTFAELDGLRKDIGRTIGKVAKANPKAGELPLLYDMKEQIEKSISDAVDSGTGITRSEAAQLRVAKDAYKETGKTYGSPLVKSITKKGDFGNTEWGTPPSTITKKIIKTPESAKQFAKAFSDNEDLMTQAKGALVDEMDKGKSWGSYFEKNKDQFKSIFGKDFGKVESIIKNVASEKKVGELASRASDGQSFTSQGVSVAKKLITDGPRQILKVLSNRALATGAGGVLGQWAGVAAGYAASSVAKWAENNIQTLVAKAMVDPKLLKDLTAEASKASLTRAVTRLVPIIGTELNKTEKPKEKNPDVIDKALNKAEAKMEEIKAPVVEQDVAIPSKEDKKLEPLFKAVVMQESGNNPKAVSSVGAQGLMQVMPETARDIAKDLGIAKYDLKDPETNKKFGQHYLKQLINKYDGDIELALTAYHSGMGRVDKLLKAYKGNSLEDILPGLGPVGKKYAREVIAKMKNPTGQVEA